MGKYSLENYMKYPVVRCRPEEDRTPVPGAGLSSFETIEIFPEGRPLPVKNTLLKVRIPAGGDPDETRTAIRSLAARYREDPAVIGVTVDAGILPAKEVAENVASAFAPKRFLVPVTDRDMMIRTRKLGFLGGLLAEVGENPLDTCEAFARNNAQRLYREIPVFVRFICPEKADMHYALQWHAAAVEGINEIAGPRIALRRMIMPAVMTSGGFAPMQFWWTNRGPSPLYEGTESRLRFVRDGQTVAELSIGDFTDRIHLGDYAFNRIIRLPELPEGEYRLDFGRFLINGEPVRLANTSAAGEGWYAGERIRIDNLPRPEMEHIWDTWRPDGYYPLEDPEVPETP